MDFAMEQGWWFRGSNKIPSMQKLWLGTMMDKAKFPTMDFVVPSDDEMFPRKQFPVRLNFAMTVNKAQGHIIPKDSVYLLEPVSSHG